MASLPRPLKTAYLIIICNPETNAPICAEIWSSPEWEQSQVLEERTFVLLQAQHETFDAATQAMVRLLRLPECKRYAWALPLLDLDRRGRPYEGWGRAYLP